MTTTADEAYLYVLVCIHLIWNIFFKTFLNYSQKPLHVSLIQFFIFSVFRIKKNLLPWCFIRNLPSCEWLLIPWKFAYFSPHTRLCLRWNWSWARVALTRCCWFLVHLTPGLSLNCLIPGCSCCVSTTTTMIIPCLRHYWRLLFPLSASPVVHFFGGLFDVAVAGGCNGLDTHTHSFVERQVERSHEERTHTRTETISRYYSLFLPASPTLPTPLSSYRFPLSWLSIFLPSFFSPN